MDCVALISLIRRKCLVKGFGSLTAFGSFFRKLDRDYSKETSMDEFQRGLAIQYDLHVSMDDCRALFRRFDVNNSGTIDFQELVRMLQPPISERRKGAVIEVFNKLNISQSGSLCVQDLREHFQDKVIEHPKYVKGIWTEDQVLENLIAGFEQPDSKDGLVSMDEFVNYYSAVSAVIDDDEFFENSLRLCWRMPQTTQPTT